MPPGLVVLGVKFLQGFVLAEISAKFFPLLFPFPTLQGTEVFSQYLSS